jgi:hypothetical protein
MTHATCLVGLTAVLLTVTSQAAGRLQPDAVFSVRGRITILAADGNRGAVSTRVKPGCGRIVVWTPPGKNAVRVKPGILGCAGDGVTQLAVGAGRIAWLEQGGGNDLEMSLTSAGLRGGVAKQIQFATNGDRAGGDPTGSWLGQLTGAGSLLAYNSWTQVCDKPSDQECGERDPQLRLMNQKLVRVVNGRRIVVARGAAAYPLAAAGGGRMAVVTANAVTIRGATGAQIVTILAAGTVRGVALSQTGLAIEKTATLDLYNPVTGTPGKSFPLGEAASLQLAGVNSKLALLRGPHRLVVVRLRDGKRISFPLRARAAATLVGARLTESGLFYAYNTSGPLPGRIVFEHEETLFARF